MYRDKDIDRVLKRAVMVLGLAFSLHQYFKNNYELMTVRDNDSSQEFQLIVAEGGLLEQAMYHLDIAKDKLSSADNLDKPALKSKKDLTSAINEYKASLEEYQTAVSLYEHFLGQSTLLDGKVIGLDRKEGKIVLADFKAQVSKDIASIKEQIISINNRITQLLLEKSKRLNEEYESVMKESKERLKK